MFFLTFIFLIITLALTYRNLEDKSIRFLYGIILGWVLSITGLILYLSSQNYYFNILNKFFFVGRWLWSKLILMNLNVDLTIRLMNLGIFLYYYSLLSFALAFTFKKGGKFRSKYIYIFLAIIPTAEFIMHDSKLYKLIMTANDPLHIYSPSFNNILHVIFRFGNLLYVLSAFFILINYYRTYANIKFFKSYTLLNIACLFPTAFVYYQIFSWAPKKLVRSTLIKGYFHYTLPDMDKYIIFVNIFPYLVVVAMTFMAWSIYKYNSIEAYYRNFDTHIRQSINTANLGVRAFTHSVKNHILAIQSEAEYLKEKHADNEETIYSLNLILDSCFRVNESLKDAANKLKDIKLDMRPTSLYLPIEKALTRFQPLKSNIRIDCSYACDTCYAYMDIKHMEEVLFNIIKNAIEAIGNEKGRIIITAEENNKEGIITISNTGSFIPEEMIEHIFEPFISAKASINNWGIGLSYCHKVIVGHGGKMNVESKEKEVTTFKIMLPLI